MCLNPYRHLIQHNPPLSRPALPSSTPIKSAMKSAMKPTVKVTRPPLIQTASTASAAGDDHKVQEYSTAKIVDKVVASRKVGRMNRRFVFSFLFSLYIYIYIH